MEPKETLEISGANLSIWQEAEAQEGWITAGEQLYSGLSLVQTEKQVKLVSLSSHLPSQTVLSFFIIYNTMHSSDICEDLSWRCGICQVDRDFGDRLPGF